MRWKIITVNSIVILVVGVLLYALLRAELSDVVSNPTQIRSDATRAVTAANAQLQLDGVRLERWLDLQTDDRALREPFEAGTQAARAQSATQQCDRIRALASQALPGTPPAIVALVDTNGICFGRNGNAQMRGEDLGKSHPKLKDTIQRGGTGSEIWYSHQLSQQWFVTFAAIRDSSDKVIGGIVYGTPLNDERMTRTTELTSGGNIAIAVPVESNLEVVAKSSSVPPDVAAAIVSGPVAQNVMEAIRLGHAAALPNGPRDWVMVAHPLGSYGDGKQAVLVAASPATSVDIALGKTILVVCALGIVLVSIAGVLLGNYISKPIEVLEEGFLQILNGRTDLRFEIEHAVFGGLVFRINTLLNQLMGVQEDDTDEDGRPSVAPSAAAFQGALEVSEKSSANTEQVDVGVAAALGAEAADSYYRRIFAEYIQAKRTIGDPVDHITETSFIERIRQREAEMAEKTGRPVRYQVQLRGKEVVLIAVQLP